MWKRLKEKEEYMKSISFKNGIDRRQNGFTILFKKIYQKKKGESKRVGKRKKDDIKGDGIVDMVY